MTGNGANIMAEQVRPDKAAMAATAMLQDGQMPLGVAVRAGLALMRVSGVRAGRA